MQMTIGFELWFVVGCFIADEYFFVGECFCGLSSEKGGGSLIWLSEGMVGDWPKVFVRACMRAPVLGVLFFCCHKCHSGWNWKYFIIPTTMCRFIENNVSFYWKHRVVLLKTTCRFTENNVLFCGKWRVVFDWRTKSCFEDGILGIFWGGVAAWKGDSVGRCFWNQCKWLLHNGLYSFCDTCDSKKHKTPVMGAHARVYSAMLFGFLPCLAIARCWASSFLELLELLVLLVFLDPLVLLENLVLLVFLVHLVLLENLPL